MVNSILVKLEYHIIRLTNKWELVFWW
jgi:hypothetical protein